MPSAKNRTCARCPELIDTRNKTGLCKDCLSSARADASVDKVVPNLPGDQQVIKDRVQQRYARDLSTVKLKYDEALRTIDRLEREHQAILGMKDSQDSFVIEPRLGSGTSEGTVCLVASDWHIEERVGPEVGTLNRYSIDIAKESATRFFQSSVRLIKLLAQDIKIDNIVLALLGDFITGNIHGEETAELAELQPMHAVVMAQNFLVSGIEFLLKHTACNLVLPCHSGNHARTTLKTRFSAENGHSLEYLMYLFLASYFRSEKRVKFIVPEGMHSYLDVYDTTIRFQHGHAVKYGGGVGGLTIPLNKAIGQWNKARHADLDVLGHFHQFRDGGNFIVNGSMIGYNGFALSIKADYERPKQALFLLDKKRGRTCSWPILFDPRT